MKRSLLGRLIVVALALPEEGLVGQRRRPRNGRGVMICLRAVSRILQIVGVAVEVARGGDDAEAVAAIVELERGQCPAVDRVGLHIERTIQRVDRLKRGQRREGRRKSVVIGILIHHAQPRIEVLAHLE